jgi:hypothetical protein
VDRQYSAARLRQEQPFLGHNSNRVDLFSPRQ